MYNKFKKLLDAHGITAYRVAKDTGIPITSLYDWGNGRSTPKQDKIQKIADYFGVPLSYFYGDEEVPQEPSYYMDREVAQIAQELHDNPDLRVMFKAARDMPKEDILAFKRLMEKWRG